MKNSSTTTVPLCYVANLDILGFKDLVCNNTHEELLSIYSMFSNGVVTESVSLFKYNKTSTSDGVSITPNLSNIFVNSMVISDSVILWTNNTSTRSFFDIMITIRFMLSHGVFLGIPLRGGLVAGPITFIENIATSNANNRQLTFFGKSIIDSFSIEKKQELSGCIIDKACLDLYGSELEKELLITPDPQRLNRAISVESLRKRGFIMDYNVPIKDGSSLCETVINWPSVISPKLPEEKIIESFARHNKTVSKPEIQLKIENTLAFYRASLPAIRLAEIGF
ncbi:MAG TPA: hypothetical protein VNW99_13830 [Cytophagaceae bacterium]|jgi:hypothetical protein|nr:hypothetical protein [Cytophagaceae bacterium]